MCIVPCIRVDMRYILHPPSVQGAMIGRHSNVSGNLPETIWEISFIWFWLERWNKMSVEGNLGPADNLNCWIFMEKYFDAHITISIHLECSAGWLSMRTCDVQLHLFAIHSSWQWRSMRAKLLTIPICKRAWIIFFSLLFCFQFSFAQIEPDCVLAQVLMKLILCCVCFKFTVIQAPSWVSEQIFTMLTVCNVPWTKNKAQWLLYYCCVCVCTILCTSRLFGRATYTSLWLLRCAHVVGERFM